MKGDDGALGVGAMALYVRAPVARRLSLAVEGVDVGDPHAEGLLDGVSEIGSGSVPQRLWAKPAITVIGIDTTSIDKSSNTLIARLGSSMRSPPAGAQIIGSGSFEGTSAPEAEKAPEANSGLAARYCRKRRRLAARTTGGFIRSPPWLFLFIDRR